MKVKEVIEFVKDGALCNESEYCCSEAERQQNEKEMNEVIDLIKELEKYKVMVWKINNEILSDEYDPIYIGDDPNKESLHNRIKNIIHEED